MKFMNCTTCSRLVQINPTGSCLGCQRGFRGTPQEDSWENSPDRELAYLELRKKEIEDALQKPKTTSVPIRKQAGRRKKVSKAHTQREKTSSKKIKN